MNNYIPNADDLWNHWSARQIAMAWIEKGQKGLELI